MKSKVKFLIFMVIVVILGIVIGTKVSTTDLKNVIKNNNIKNNSIITKETHNEIEKNVDINETEKAPTPEENIVSNEVISTNANVIKENLSEEEKALNIVKKDWGEDSNVYFKYEGIDAGKHIVSVREKETTIAINWYIIDIEKETFEIN